MARSSRMNSKDPTAPAFPEVLRQEFEPIRPLGSGAQAAVFLARQRRLDRKVVIKISRARMGESQVADRRFLREAKLLQDLHHPNLVELLDFGTAPGLAWMVYPDESGRSLAEVLDESPGPTPAGRTVTILEDVLSGLAVLHGAGVVHRDLKPANLLVTPSGAIRILDLGLARDLHAETMLTAEGAAVGTPTYMAPDQIQGHPAEAADDLYAVGILAHRLFSGRHPFQAEDIGGILTAHLLQVPPRLDEAEPRLGREMADWVQMMTAKTRTGRPRDAAEALAMLRAADPRGEVTTPSGSEPAGTAGAGSRGDGVWGSGKPGDEASDRGSPAAEATTVAVGDRVPRAVPTSTGRTDPVSGKAGRRGEGWKSGALLAFLLLVGFGFLAGGGARQGQGQGATGGSDPGMGAPEVPGPDTRRGSPDVPEIPWPGLAERARRGLSEWLDRAAAGPGPGVDAPVLEDGLRFGLEAARLGPVVEVVGWLEAGGDPAHLGPAGTEELREADGAFREAGLPAPFENLEPLPTGPGSLEVLPEERFAVDAILGDWIPPPVRFHGPAALALAELRVVAAEVEDLTRRMASGGTAADDTALGNVARLLAAAGAGAQGGLAPAVMQLVQYGGSEERSAIVAMLRDANLHFRRSMVAAVRALSGDRDSVRAGLFLLSSGNNTYRLGLARIGPHLMLPFPLQAPAMPGTVEGWFGELMMLTRIEETRTLMGLPRGGLDGRIRDRLARVLGDRRGDPGAQRIRGMAMKLLPRFLHRETRLDEVPEWVSWAIARMGGDMDREERTRLLAICLGHVLPLGSRHAQGRRSEVEAAGPPIALVLDEAGHPELAASVREHWPDMPEVAAPFEGRDLPGPDGT